MAPEVARVPRHDRPAAERHGMIEGRERRDASRRHARERLAHAAVLAGVQQLEPRQRPQAAPEHALEPRAEEQHERERTHGRDEAREHEAIQPGQHSHEAPQHHLGVVPGPGREPHEEERGEEGERRHEHEERVALAGARRDDERCGAERQPETEVPREESERRLLADDPARRPARRAGRQRARRPSPSTDPTRQARRPARGSAAPPASGRRRAPRRPKTSDTKPKLCRCTSGSAPQASASTQLARR